MAQGLLLSNFIYEQTEAQTHRARQRQLGQSGVKGQALRHYKQHGLGTFPDEYVEICIMLPTTEHSIA